MYEGLARNAALWTQLVPQQGLRIGASSRKRGTRCSRILKYLPIDLTIFFLRNLTSKLAIDGTLVFPITDTYDDEDHNIFFSIPPDFPNKN